MRLDIKHWQLLEAVARFGSLGQAAEVIGVTQSALSHRLAEAERRLGSEIFERDGRRLRITPAGKSLIQTATAVLPELARAEQDFQRIANEASHLIKIGIAVYSSYHWVPGFLKSLPMSKERLQIDFVAAATRDARNSLLSGATDLLISPGKIEHDNFICELLFDDELVLITQPEHPLAQKPFIEATDLINQDYLTYSLDTQPGFEYERFIRPSGVRPRHIQLVEMTDAITEMVSVGLGVSILSRWALDRPISSGLVAATPITNQQLPINWYLISRKTDQANEAIGVTKRLLLEWFSD